MSKFALLDKILEKYEDKKIISNNEDNTKINNGNKNNIIEEKKYEENNCDQNVCEHKNIINQEYSVICLNCGEVIQNIINHEKEWRFYGYSDSKRSSDPNRVQMRKDDTKNIRKDVENMDFSQSIIEEANKLYLQVVGDQIYRGNSRKSIIFACIFYAYKLKGNYQKPEYLRKIFNITKKSSLAGLRIVNTDAPENSPIHLSTDTTVHHIRDIMTTQFNSNKKQVAEVLLLYKKTLNRSSKLNRSRPQSVAASLVYFWICFRNVGIELSTFAEQVGLSELTIKKNAEEIRTILNTNIKL